MSVVKILSLTCVQPWAPHDLQSSFLVPSHSSQLTAPVALQIEQSVLPFESQLSQVISPFPEQEAQSSAVLPPPPQALQGADRPWQELQSM